MCFRSLRRSVRGLRRGGGRGDETELNGIELDPNVADDVASDLGMQPFKNLRRKPSMVRYTKGGREIRLSLSG